jgi:hypothetical protein
MKDIRGLDGLTVEKRLPFKNSQFQKYKMEELLASSFCAVADSDSSK